MDIFTTFFLAIGLAMDAFAVSITSGASVARLRRIYAFKIAFLFGLFQGLMPVLGWLIGLSFKDFIVSVDHWVAFILLAVIGGRMIYADIKTENKKIEQTAPKSFSALIALSIATSIDALVVGIGFIVLSSILTQVVMIGVTTFLLCLAGVYWGHRYKHFAGKKVNATGGVILILIGLKILVEHLF